MPYVSRDGVSVYYDECKIYRDKCEGIYNSLNSIKSSISEINSSYTEMIALIPRFGDEYDSLGNNTKVNIESFSEISAEAIKKIEKINSTGFESAQYYNDAKNKDEDETGKNKSAAEHELESKLASLGQ